MNPNEKSVTSEGVPQDLDLGHVDAPTEDAINSLDKAMDAAGIGDGIVPDRAAPVEEPAKPDEPGEEAPTGEPPAETPAGNKLAAVKPEDAKPAETELENIDLDTLKAPKDISPRNLVNFDKLRDVAKHFKTQAAQIPQLQQKLQELETRQVQMPQDLVKELEELRMFRRVFDTENDPEFQKQFNDKLGALDSAVLDILTKNGLPKETAEQIQQIGLDKVSPRWWEEAILSKLSFVDRERVQKRLAERADTVDQRFKEIQKFQADREVYTQRAQQERIGQFEKTQAEIYQHLDNITANVPWARYQELPETATKEQKKQIEAHNAEVAELEKQFKQALFPETPQARAEVAAAAVASTKLAASVQDLAARLNEANAKSEKLQKEIESIRVAGRAPSARQSGTRKPSSDIPDPSKLSDEDAIEQGLIAAESAL